MTGNFDIGSMVIERKPDVMIETGVSAGASTKQILAAMDTNKRGRLFSVEPFTDPGIDHPRWVFCRGYSVDLMPKIFTLTGPWCLFLHDSDHSVGCMTFEFELAWKMLRPGGVLAADDAGWGDPPHDAWINFTRRNGVSDAVWNALRYCVKPADSKPITNHDIPSAIWAATGLANEACVKYGKKPYLPTHLHDKDYVLNFG